MPGESHVEGAGELTRALQAAGAATLARAAGITRTYGLMLQARVKANAAGRPGPRIITGDYSRSIVLDLGTPGPNQTEAVVSTNAVQAHRLELGAVGVDSLGRHMHSPPYAHFGPGFDAIAPAYEAALRDVLP